MVWVVIVEDIHGIVTNNSSIWSSNFGHDLRMLLLMFIVVHILTPELAAFNCRITVAFRTNAVECCGKSRAQASLLGICAKSWRLADFFLSSIARFQARKHLRLQLSLSCRLLNNSTWRRSRREVCI
jgi:hypothetical protein